MKSIFKRILKRLWRLTDPIRHPVAERFGGYLRKKIQTSEQALSDEVNILLNHVVRELHRTRRHVEQLQDVVDGVAADKGRQLIAIPVDEPR